MGLVMIYIETDVLRVSRSYAHDDEGDIRNQTVKCREGYSPA